MTARPDTAPIRPTPDSTPCASADIDDIDDVDDTDRTDDGDVAERLVAVSFSLPADVSANSASVVGDFNRWDPSLGVMEVDDEGSFVCTLSVTSGRRYQYRFLLDGDRWANDWFAQGYTPNEFGGDDSVLDLTEPDLTEPDTAGSSGVTDS